MSMSEDPQFREKVLTGITRTETKVDSLIEHVKTINGSVRTLYDRTRESEQALSRHSNDCPAKAMIAELERQISTGDYPGSRDVKRELGEFRDSESERKGREKANKDWFKILQPWINWIILGVLSLIMLHYGTVIKQIGIPK
jgi:hypothetical protein